MSSAYVTRSLLGLGHLDLLTDPYDILIEGLDPGQRSWRRTTAESPFVPGRVLMNAVLDTPTRLIPVDVSGTDLADVQTNVAALIAAFSQMHYQVHITLGTAEYAWVCEPADLNVGFTYQHVLGRICPVTLSVPSSPIPVAGPV